MLVPRPGSLLEGSLWHPDPSTLTGADALRVLADIGRARSFLAALEALAVERVRLACEDEARVAAGRADRGPERFGGDVGHALAVSEVAVAEGISEWAAARLLKASESLCGPQLAVLSRLECGMLSEAHARVITEETATLPADMAEEFGIECLGRLETRSGRRRAAGEFRAVVRGLRERQHPETIRARKARAMRDRGVWVRPEPDGMCTLNALLPAEVGLAAVGRVDGIARAVRRADPEEGRTLPQLRADILSGLILGSSGGDATGSGPTGGDATGSDSCPIGGQDPPPEGPASRSAKVPRTPAGLPGPAKAAFVPSEGAPGPAEGVPVPAAGVPVPAAEIVVYVPAGSLLGLSDEPAVLEGYGPIDAETARALAVVAPTWQLLSIGADGIPLSLGRTAYRPPKRLRRFIEYRDGTCLFPGCSRPARKAEIDHITEWQDGGTTDAVNLQALCEKHHALKSLRLWNSSRLEAEAGESCGPVLWVSPLGARAVAGPIDRELGDAGHTMPMDHATPAARSDLGPPPVPDADPGPDLNPDPGPDLNPDPRPDLNPDPPPF